MVVGMLQMAHFIWLSHLKKTNQIKQIQPTDR